MAVIDIPTLKTYFETGDFPTQSQFVDLIDTLAALPSGGGTYDKYVALLTQAGTDAPVATVLENTLSGSIVWTYDNVGTYFGNLTEEFTSAKTVCIINALPPGRVGHFTFGRGNVNRVQLESYDDVFNPANDLLFETTIEIRVYP